MKTCKNCGTVNDDHVNYCQSCGESIFSKGKIPFTENFKLWAGFQTKGNSIAPLACMGMENQAKKEMGKVTKIPVVAKVTPRQDGSWFCPDCGELNAPYARVCKSCGRDFN